MEANEIRCLKARAKKAEPSTRKLFSKLKQNIPRRLDETVMGIHDEVFEKTDCLSCANCCKTTSPIFYGKDIERIAKQLKLRPSEFIQQYLHIDEDKDYVLNQAPCPFLAEDNTCRVYENRPNACREYPHTHRKRFQQVFELTIKNTYVCPAAYNIVEKLKQVF